MGPDHPEAGELRRAPARRRLLLWAPVAAMMAVQVWLSSRSPLPSLPLLPSFPGNDKLVHASWFFLLGLLVWRAAREAEGWPRRRTTLLLVLGALLWGISDEAHQSFVPGRDVEAADVAADVAGATLTALVADPLLRRLRLVSVPPPA
ncbi:MAG: VanZ family protein [Holophagales bacterium]|nr:VanZ family protein [Holophagales bacterium]